MVAGGWVVASGEWVAREWVADWESRRGFRIGELVARETVARETGIRKRIRGIAESRKRGFGIDGCAHFVRTECQEFGEFTPGTRNPAPETPRKPPN